MQRLLIVILIVAGCVLGFRIGIRRSPQESRQPRAAQATDSTLTRSSQAVRIREETARDLVLRRIAESDTYLPAMIEESDSMLRRWRERQTDPLRVHIDPGDVQGVTPRKIRAVQDAFRRWERVPEIPIDFVYTQSPERAEVIVRWIEAFEVERAGQAEVMWRSDGYLRSGTLTLATHTHNELPLSVDAVFTVALHEIGHLLGLGHSNEPKDVMYPTTGVHDLTRRDRQTAMLLYNLPPGRLNR